MNKNKELLLKYLCMSLPYGVKILHTGWDCDSGTDFDTVETLIGIDDKFIYTVWDKTGDREKHCLSVSNWKPYLRPMSSMTDEECKELGELPATINNIGETFPNTPYYIEVARVEQINWLLENHFDFMDLIPEGLALEAPKGMYN